jgi:hypothetical protein
MKEENIKNVFLRDQTEGAATHAESILRIAGETVKGKAIHNDDDAPYNFLDTYFGQKYKFTQTDEGLRSVISCKHLDPYVPSIIYSHMLMPKLYACSVDSLEQSKKAKNMTPDMCDFCATSGHSIFSEFMTSIGPMIIHGNVCVPCLEKHIKSVDVAKERYKSE